VQLRAFPKPVMDASYQAVQEVYAEINGKNAEFKKIFDSYFAFQREQIAWHGVAEARFDQFMQSVR
jgi:TRAP-type mannitol/chloroaromatic compound transport system substrate-binding protein